MVSIHMTGTIGVQVIAGAASAGGGPSTGFGVVSRSELVTVDIACWAEPCTSPGRFGHWRYSIPPTMRVTMRKPMLVRIAL